MPVKIPPQPVPNTPRFVRFLTTPPKKQTRVLLIAAAVLVLAFLVSIPGTAAFRNVVSNSWNQHSQEQQEIRSFVEENKQLIYDSFPSATSVTIEYGRLEVGTHGGVIVYGYLNNDKSLYFVTSLYLKNNSPALTTMVVPQEAKKFEKPR